MHHAVAGITLEEDGGSCGVVGDRKGRFGRLEQGAETRSGAIGLVRHTQKPFKRAFSSSVFGGMEGQVLYLLEQRPTRRF
jgi:hypothetical protein